MKRPYEKPTLIDLSLPTARAGRLPGGGASPQGICHDGFGVGVTDGGCNNGAGPDRKGLCFSGQADAGTGNSCFSGFGR
jgi:hypothetical protein